MQIRTRRSFMTMLASLPLIGAAFKTKASPVSRCSDTHEPERIICIVTGGVIFNPARPDASRLNVYPVDGADVKGFPVNSNRLVLEQETLDRHGQIGGRQHQFGLHS